MKPLILAASVLAAFAAFAATGAAQAQAMDGAGATFPPYAAGFQPHAYLGAGVAIAKDQTTGDYRGNAKLYAGYDLTPNWGVEAGYTHYGSQTFWAYAGNNQFSPMNVKGFSSYVAAKYTMPLSERLSAFGKLGVEHSERRVTGANAYDYAKRDTGAYGALGLQYSLAPNLAVSAEYERYGKDKDFGAKADAITVGLKYGF